MIRCCQSIFTSRREVSTPSSFTLVITNRVIPILRIRIFIAGSEFLCSRNTFTFLSAAWAVISPTASTNRFQVSAYGRWNG